MSDAPHEKRTPHPLDPALLIAAAINASGELDLPSAEGGRAEMVRYFPDGQGQIVRRRGEACEAADLRQVAAGLHQIYGALTPDAFRLTEPALRARSRFVVEGADADRTRVHLLHRAFNIYLLAFEERLV